MLRTAGVQDRARLVAFLDAHRAGSCRARRCGSPPSTSRPASAPATSSPRRGRRPEPGDGGTYSAACVSGAAFFDLDRTLLAGASGEVFSGAMRAAGFTSRSIPGERLRLPDVRLHRRDPAGHAADPPGRPAGQGRLGGCDAVREASRPPTASPPSSSPTPCLIEEHHPAGRPVAIATTTPNVLVRPFAKRLGLDDVVATRRARRPRALRRLARRASSCGPREAAGARDWSADHGISLRASYAYPDSFYDVPMLDAVGHPVAVNPDSLLALMRRCGAGRSSTSTCRPGGQAAGGGHGAVAVALQ